MKNADDEITIQDVMEALSEEMLKLETIGVDIECTNKFSKKVTLNFKCALSALCCDNQGE